jgi:hypothetical protein
VPSPLSVVRLCGRAVAEIDAWVSLRPCRRCRMIVATPSGIRLIIGRGAVRLRGRNMCP